jgi:hypothetical protein
MQCWWLRHVPVNNIGQENYSFDNDIQLAFLTKAMHGQLFFGTVYHRESF